MEQESLADVRCRYCQADGVVRAGRRKTRGGPRQLYLCPSCGRRFSTGSRSARRTPPDVVLEALKLVCHGRTYEETRAALFVKYRSSVSKSAFSKWISEFHPLYLAIRRFNEAHRQIVRSYLFTHAGFNYNFQIHLPKLATCPHVGLNMALGRRLSEREESAELKWLPLEDSKTDGK